jgi:hypothetical protein
MAPADSTPLSRDLEGMARRHVARMRQSRPVVTAYAAPAAPTEAKAVGMMKSIKIGGRFYTWRQLSDPAIRREILPQVEALIAQVKRDPAAFGYTAEDVKAAVAWTTGQYDGMEEHEMAKLTGAFQPGAAAAPYQQLAELMSKPEMRVALQRSRTGQPLDATQQKLVARHDELMLLNSQQARSERPYSGGKLGPTTKYIPSAIRDLAKLPDVERANRSREMIAALRKDERWARESHPEHAQALYEMELLYND